MRKRSLWLLLIVASYCAWAVVPASAHAILLRSNPAANAILAQAPVQVELFFSETLEAASSSIKVYDSAGGRADLADVRVDPADGTRMTVSLHSLPDGVYTVSWSATSKIDGHQTTGSFPFAVGTVSASELPAGQQNTSASLPVSELIAKWLLLVSAALLAGQLTFILLVWEPAIKRGAEKVPEEIRRPASWNKLYQIGAICLLLAFGVGVLAQAGQANGTELALPWRPEAGRTLLDTRLGLFWLVRLLLALICIWLTQGAPAVWKRWAAFAAGAALLLSISLTSHAATQAHPALAVLDDWIHLLGMTFWFGGLAYLVAGMRALGQLEEKLRTRLAALILARFSNMAMVSVALIGLTGLYSASLRVGTLSALFATIYGHALLLKQGFVAALLLIAAINLLVITPRLNRDRLQGAASAPLLARFGKIVLGEAILAGLLLMSVSLLTYLPPANLATAVGDLTGSVRVDDLKIELSISPGRVGQNTFTLRLASDGQPLQTSKEVLLRFTPQQGNIPPSDLDLIGQGNGTFTAKGAYLSLPGKWQVQVIVRREDKFDAFANFNFTIERPGSARQSSASPQIAGALILIIGWLFGLVMLSAPGKAAYRYAGGGLLSLLIVGLGFYYMVRPAPAGNERANPIPPNSQSVAAGQSLFTTYCVACHGASGKGDGPVGLTLNPRPADLTLHAVPGVHTDAQLFEWITNGFPGSRMPAFRSILSDTDRWNLVNFIRTLAPK
jgi:copper transport protein